MFLKFIRKRECRLEFFISAPFKHQPIILFAKPGNIELLLQDRLITELQGIDVGDIKTNEFYSQS